MKIENVLFLLKALLNIQTYCEIETCKDRYKKLLGYQKEDF